LNEAEEEEDEETRVLRGEERRALGDEERRGRH